MRFRGAQTSADGPARPPRAPGRFRIGADAATEDEADYDPAAGMITPGELRPLTEDEIAKGGLWRRSVAYLLDRALVGVLVTSIAMVLGLWENPAWAPGDPLAEIFAQVQPLMIVGLVVEIAYFVLLQASWGATPMMRLLRLRVTRRDLGPAGLIPVFLRHLLLQIEMTLILPHLANIPIASLSERRRTLHDRLSGSIIVKLRR